MRLWILVPATLMAFVGCSRVPDDTADDTDTDTDIGTDPDTDPLPEGCPDSPTGEFFGQLEASQIVDANPYADANLAAVVATFDGVADGATKDVDVAINNAVVAAIGYTPSSATAHWSVWLADANGAVRTYLNESTGTIPSTVKVGDVLSLRVKKIKNFGGEFEILDVSDVVVAADTSKVWLQEPTGELSYASHGRELVHVWGEVTSTPADCGSYQCMDLDLDGQVVDFRIKADKGVKKGDCLDVVAPVGVYMGDVQFNIDNFDWVDFY